MNPELEPLSLRILSALLNGGYQGLLLTGLFWLGLKLLPRINAATRHAVGLVTLLLVAALPLFHLLMSGAPSRPRALPDELTRLSPARVPIHVDSRELAALPAVPTGPSSWRPSIRSGAGATTGVPSTGAAWRAALSWELSLGLLGLWTLLAALRLGKLTGECWWLRSLKRRGAAPPDALSRAFGALCRQMRMRREPRLLVVPGSAAPMAVGYRNPAVVLPANLLTQSADGALEPILRHELAHLRRGDDWSNLVQQLLKALLFFHPGVWWLSRRLTLDREIACDDHVLASARAPKAYALLLTEFAGRVQYRHCSAAPAGWSRHSQLKERITMILDPKRNASPQLAVAPMGTFITAAALLAAVSLSAAPRLELAESSGGQANPFAFTEVDVQLAHAGPPPVPPTQPGPPPAPPLDRELRDGEFMEQRIERLERMIEELMGEGAPKFKPDAGKSLKSSDKRTEKDAAKSWQFNYDFKKEFDHAFKDFQAPEIAEITRQARQEAERAVREAGRMAEETKRAHWDAIRQHQLDARNLRNAQSWEVQRQVLEAERQALEMQRSNLEAQIARLEEERDQIEARVEQHEGLLDQLQEEAKAEESEADDAFDHEHDHASEDGRDKGPQAPLEKPSSEQLP